MLCGHGRQGSGPHGRHARSGAVLATRFAVGKPRGLVGSDIAIPRALRWFRFVSSPLSAELAGIVRRRSGAAPP